MITPQHTTIFIFSILALIFAYDALAIAFGQNATISQVITDKIQESWGNMAIFWGVVVALCVHWAIGLYKKK